MFVSLINATGKLYTTILNIADIIIIIDIIKYNDNDMNCDYIIR